MKIKVTAPKNNNKFYYEGDIIPDGIYIDADDDIVIAPKDYEWMIISRGGEVVGDSPSWPIIKAPAGTKVEFTV